MGALTTHALAYSMCAMIVGTAVSSLVHVLKLDETPKGKAVLSVSLDLVGLGKAVYAMFNKDAS